MRALLLLVLLLPACDEADENVGGCGSLSDCPAGYVACVNGECSRKRERQGDATADAAPSDGGVERDQGPTFCEECVAKGDACVSYAGRPGCCPAETPEPVTWSDMEMGCCPEGEKVAALWEDGSRGCCTEDAPIASLDSAGAPRCCPAASPVPRLTEDGDSLCCPEQLALAVKHPDDGELRCCPEDKPSPARHEDGTGVCCPPDRLVVGLTQDRYICCYEEAPVAVVHPAGFTGCSPTATPTPRTTPSGADICCGEEQDLCPDGEGCCP